MIHVQDLSDIQREHPSAIEELFRLAIMRLRKAVKLRKEAIEYFRRLSGHKEAATPEESSEPREEPPSPNPRLQLIKQFQKQGTDKSMSLRQIDEKNESESLSSESSGSSSSQET